MKNCMPGPRERLLGDHLEAPTLSAEPLDARTRTPPETTTYGFEGWRGRSDGGGLLALYLEPDRLAVGAGLHTPRRGDCGNDL